MVNGPSRESVLAALAIVRMTWVIAVLVLVLAIVSALLSGNGGGASSHHGFPFPNGGDSSQQLPGLTLFDPHASGLDAGMTLTAAHLQNDRTRHADQQARGESPSSSDLPDRSGSQPDGDGGRAPGVTSQPNGPQAPSKTSPAPSETSPDPPQAPSVSRPSLPQAPSTSTSTSDTPSVSEPDPPEAPSIPSEPRVSVSVSTEPTQASVTVANTTVKLP
jgi:hypothetical protein